MNTNVYGQPVFSEDDLIDRLMQGVQIANTPNVLVDSSVDINSLLDTVEDLNQIDSWKLADQETSTVVEWDRLQQSTWFMPTEYKNFDIAKHVLELCKTDAELQRVGEELLLYQEKDLFNLLKYLKYLVDIMKENNIIWGVGRGSSVASYVLYLLEVHRINSMYYDLDVHEFLR